jgi:hypothetical protein
MMMENVVPVLIEHFSMSTVFAPQYPIIVKIGVMRVEHVLVVIQDTSYTKEIVFWLE